MMGTDIHAPDPDANGMTPNYMAGVWAEALHFIAGSNPIVFKGDFCCFYCGRRQRPFTKIVHEVGCVYVRIIELDRGLME